MASSPAFQLYPDRFIAATGRMTPAQTHVYMWLLYLEWKEVGFVLNPPELARWCRVTPKVFNAAWAAAVHAQFVERDGKLYSPHLDEQRAKQDAWRKKSSNGGKRSGAQRRERAATTDESKGGSTTLQPPFTDESKGGSTTLRRVVEQSVVSSVSDPVSTPSGNAEALAADVPPAEEPPAPTPRGGYPAEFAATYAEVTGAAVSPGEIGRACKPLVARYGVDEVRARFARWCASRDRRFGVGYFAKQFDAYAESAPALSIEREVPVRRGPSRVVI